MEDLFQAEEPSADPSPSSAASARPGKAPLAERMRPRTLDEYIGQSHILGPGKLLRRAVEADRFHSLIFYGPPGVGKTSLAQLISHQTNTRFVNLSGVESNVSEIRKAVEVAEQYQKIQDRATTLFVDEIHRFNKAQQDVLLPHIERGSVRFIGATTHNPYFYVNSPLVSRSLLFELEPIHASDLEVLLHRALADAERGYGTQLIDISPEAAQHLAARADGDARKLLTALELAVLTTPLNDKGVLELTLEVAEESIQQKAVVYDGDGDAHYDTISAFIKSIRGSDPDAALYWLAKMLYAGEDPRFIARRLVISASEDIGLADSNGLRVALAAHQSAELLGMPEGRIPLAHATVYLATAPKSNRAYVGINAALDDVKKGQSLAVPPHLRTRTRKKIAEETGKESRDLQYLYAHDYDEGYVPQSYLPEGRIYYHPSEHGMEQRVKERLEHWRKQFEKASDA